MVDLELKQHKNERTNTQDTAGCVEKVSVRLCVYTKHTQHTIGI